MADLKEAIDAILVYRPLICRLYYKFHLYRKYYNELDVLGQIIADISEEVAVHYSDKSFKKAQLSTYVYKSIYNWFFSQVYHHKKEKHCIPFTNLTLSFDEEIEFTPVDPNLYGLPAKVSDYEHDVLYYTLYNLPLYYRDFMLSKLEGLPYRERAKKHGVSFQRMAQIDSAISRFMLDYVSTHIHQVPEGFSRTFTFDQIGMGENRDWNPRKDLTFPCVCAHCGIAFRSRSRVAKYCSDECRSEHDRYMKQKKKNADSDEQSGMETL